MNERKVKEAKLAELKSQLLTVEGTPTEVYSRIVGYYRSVRNWNAGKRAEYGVRRTYEVETLAQPAPAVPQTTAASKVYNVTPATQSANGKEAAGQSMAEAYLLFTRKTCPGCGPVKDYLQTSGLRATEIDVDTPDGLETARQYNVMATPTAILFGAQGEEKIRAFTRSQLDGFLKGRAGSKATITL